MRPAPTSTAARSCATAVLQDCLQARLGSELLRAENPKLQNQAMNQNRRLSVGALLAACWLFLPSFSHLFAQGGSLTPPGAPAPTMKTLDQVEARKPIGPATAPVAISTPGSYYLAGDIVISNTQGGINITSGDVTLDLNGFAIRKAPGSTSGTAISVNAPADNSGRN